MQVTHCPECATAFKVTPEQLQLAGGWVRCGRCGAVFEALKHLQPVPEAPVSVLPSVPPQEVLPHAPAEHVAPTVQRAAHHVAQDQTHDLGMLAGEPTFQAETLGPTPAESVEPASAHSQPKSYARVLWIALSALMLCLLLWQWVLHKRDWLMAQEPGLRGTLSVLCAPVGCTPAWPRLPESLQIDSSSFTHDPQGFYSVQLRIKNTEHFTLAAPHVELSLLDVYDDVVLRRVLSPDELKLAAHIAPLRDARASLEFDLSAPLAQRVTGYRVLLFYP